jgi:hypothetical protein
MRRLPGFKLSRYSKVRSPALSIAAVGFSGKASAAVEALPDSHRTKAQDYLSRVTRYQWREIERFRNQIPNGEVVVLTSADHHCFIHREEDVVREMRRFLGK